MEPINPHGFHAPFAPIFVLLGNVAVYFNAIHWNAVVLVFVSDVCKYDAIKIFEFEFEFEADDRCNVISSLVRRLVHGDDLLTTYCMICCGTYYFNTVISINKSFRCYILWYQLLCYMYWVFNTPCKQCFTHLLHNNISQFSLCLIAIWFTKQNDKFVDNSFDMLYWLVLWKPTNITLLV